MPTVSTSADWLTAIGTCVYALATVTLAVAAFFGLRSWRTQLRGRSDYDLARQILQMVFKLREQLQYGVRNMWMLPGEYVDRPGRPVGSKECDADDKDWAYQKRWNQADDIYRQLAVQLLEAEALWGIKLNEARTKLDKCRVDLMSATRKYVSDNRSQIPPQDMEQHRYILETVFGGSEPDQFLNRLNEAIKMFEDKLRPRLV